MALKKLPLIVLIISIIFVGVYCSKVFTTPDNVDLLFKFAFTKGNNNSSRIRGAVNNANEQNQQYWNDDAERTLDEQLQRLNAPNTNKAKNVIFFLGDGMSLETIAATRMYMGNENVDLSFETFPFVGMSKTYCVDKQVADSACSSTAYLSGVKANYGTIGVNSKVQRNDCAADLNRNTYTESIAKWAQDDCRATGIVTTSRVTHASPAGVFAHISNRDWENDANIRASACDPNLNTDIARQLIEWDVGSKMKVILGGGRAEFRNATMLDEETGSGNRNDGRDLITEWQWDRSTRGAANYVWNREQLQRVDYENTDYLLGLFEPSHCHYNLDITENGLQDVEPTLSEMTEAAIKILGKEENGYFLFVEGARIDMAHHENWAIKALDETKEFSKAVEVAKRLTQQEDTLIVVTADHGHTLTYSGYPVRGRTIFDSEVGYPDWMGTDGMPYNTLSYANGMGYYNTYKPEGRRIDPRSLNYSNIDLRFPAHVPLESETHGGADVSVYALGPWSHLFVGSYEQNSIPMLMAYSAQIGPYSREQRQCSSGHVFKLSVYILIGFMIQICFSFVKI